MANPYEQFTSDVSRTPEGIPRITVRPAAADENPYAKFVPADQSKPKTTAPEAFGRGILTGATFNFYDELNGLARAGGLDPEDPDVAHAMKSLFVGAYRKFKGDAEAEKLYEEERDKRRAETKQMETEHPVASAAGNVAGSVAVPLGAMGTAATLPGRIRAGIATGAAVGGVSGFGHGEGLADSAVQAGTGTAIGAGLGAVTPPIVEGLVRGGNALIRPLGNMVTGAFNPEGEAARRVVSALQRDVAADPGAVSRLTPQEFAASQQSGGPARIMDLGGETTRALSRSAANTSPEGRFALNDVINNRSEGQAGRITDWLRNTFNFPNAFAQRQAITDEARTVNQARYNRAFQTHTEPMWDESLAGLAQDPLMQSAIRRASVAVRTDRTIEGQRPFNNPFTFEESTGRLTLRRDPNGNTMYPDLQFWDAVKKELDKQGTRESSAFARTLREHLDGLTTDPTTGRSLYQSAREGAMHFFGAENALEAGQNFVSMKLANREVQAQLANMTPQQRQLFQDGFVSRYIETLESVADRRSVLNKIAESPEAREKLRMVLGQQRANEIEAGLRIEGIMDFSRNAVQGNSTTARQLIEWGLAGGSGVGGAFGTLHQDPTTMGIAALTASMVAGRRYIDHRVATRVAQMLSSNDPAMLQTGMRILARNNNLMEGLRATDRHLANAAIQPASRAGPAIQGPMRAAAEPDQPQPVGPVQQ